MKLALTLSEAIEASSLSKNRLYDALNSGALKAKKAGKRTIILAADLEAFLTSLPSYEPQSAGGQANG